jgi:hypothetical protein
MDHQVGIGVSHGALMMDKEPGIGARADWPVNSAPADLSHV